MPTKYHLRLEDAITNLYKLDIPFMYNYDVLLAENYTLEIILPYGASDIEVSCETLALLMFVCLL